ncbi:MAG: hypothetical protein E7041_07960 [Lentisphaerae bacterium]|nr:hypothetical protein [Lentisphaerota bacterium]
MAESKLRTLFLVILCVALLPLDVWAKRAAPQPVKTLLWSVYKIQPSGDGSSAKITVSKICKCYFKPKTITIYEINYLKSLETDVQNLHITKLEIDNGVLWVKTEKDGIFSCNITTGKVKLVKLPQGYEQIKTGKASIVLKFYRTH